MPFVFFPGWDCYVPTSQHVTNALRGALIPTGEEQLLPDWISIGPNFRLCWAENEFGIVIAEGDSAWPAVARIPGFKPLQHDPSNHSMRYMRGWYNVRRPWEMWKPCAITPYDRQRISA